MPIDGGAVPYLAPTHSRAGRRTAISHGDTYAADPNADAIHGDARTTDQHAGSTHGDASAAGAHAATDTHSSTSPQRQRRWGAGLCSDG